ncbi:septum formation initiator family protein [Rhodoferax sp.]|jgi:cell division protein FtsB|uniref:septum formation initiator family protein n=1 Tax=Rhodoferax sp. TaxID=50421 RepID=UPI003782EA61
MAQRLVTWLLITLLVVVHGQLWLGRGSVSEVSRLKTQVEDKRQSNAQASVANARLEAEIRDLREGLEIVEEKARLELGMVKNDEILVHIAQ